MGFSTDSSTMNSLPSEWLETAIRIPPFERTDRDALARFLAACLEDAGMRVETLPTPRGNGIFAWRGSATDPAAMLFHTGLGPPDRILPEKWTKTLCDPFRATASGERLYGLGTAGGKVDLLARIWALRATREAGRPAAVLVLPEEADGATTGRLLDAGRLPMKRVLVGAPTDCRLVPAEKGGLRFSARLPLPTAGARGEPRRWRSKPAPAASVEARRNALERGLLETFKRGARLLELRADALDEWSPETCEAMLVTGPDEGTRRLFAFYSALEEIARELSRERDARFAPQSGTLCLQRARTADGMMTIEGVLSALPSRDLDALAERLRRAAEAQGLESLQTTVRPGFRGRRDDLFLAEASETLRDAGGKTSPATRNLPSDAGRYRRAGASVLVFGVGKLPANSAGANEYVSVPSLRRAIAFYRGLLAKEREV